ncbi:MAG: HAD family hydrolase [Thermoanaerobacteraceae bacterium]|nr:HAD family hydrolase [Thermoanaerobacteraceae bacterium]
MKALLLDLDGTLSHMDVDRFLQTYLAALAQKFTRWLEPKVFIKQVMASTVVMVNNNQPEKTNKDVFLDDFFRATGLERDFLWQEFYKFYAEEFSQFRRLVTTNPLGKELVATAREKGWKVVIASNPVQPKVAMEERIRWGGLDPEEVDFIPSLEEMHFCKPNPRYFLELAERAGVHPQDCLMVGNDEREDLAAAKAGMRTFLITEEPDKNTEADYCGQLEDLLAMIKTGEI